MTQWAAEHGALRAQRRHSFYNSRMALLPVLQFPDPRLHTVAKPVSFDAPGTPARMAQLTQDMLDTMHAEKGIGLAATQVNVHERVVVIDVSEAGDAPLVLINPELVWQSPEREVAQEGCLSVPGVYDKVERALAVHVRAQDAAGNNRVIEADGLLAVCIQHEMDHLMGKVFVEYLSLLKRSRIKAKLLKAARDEARD
jgi:peptide deformylase